MARRLSSLALCAAVLCALAPESRADTVTYRDSARQTSAGQNFHFTFTGVPASDGPGTFTIRARGDYTRGYEHIDWSIDGIASGTAGPGNGATVLRVFNANDKLWKQRITIPGNQMDLITQNGQIDIWLDLTRCVNILHRTDFVKVKLKYRKGRPSSVPEPTGLAALLVLGAGAVALGRRFRTA